MKNWIQFVVKNAKLVMLATVAITVLLVFQFKNLRLVIDPDQILPADHPFVVANQKVEDLFGNKFTVVVSASKQTGEFSSAGSLEELSALTKDLLQLPGIIPQHSIGLATDAAKILAENDLHRFFQKLLVSDDKKSSLIVLEFRKIDGGFKAIDSSIRTVTAKYDDQNLRIRISGLPIFLAKLESYSERMAVLFPLALLLIGMIHYEAFRTLQALILPLVTALLAVIWAVGLLSLLGQSFDVFNATTPILILAIAAGHAVQILKRYYEEHRELESDSRTGSPKDVNKQVVVTTMVKVGPVMIIACTVAALGFLSLLAFDVPTIRTFGLFSALGVISALAIELSFIPALRVLLPVPSKIEIAKEGRQSFWKTAIDWIHERLTRSPRNILLVCVGLMVIFSIGSLRIRLDNSQKDLFFESLDLKNDDKFINKHFAGTNLIYILITKSSGTIFEPKVLAAISELQEAIEASPQVGKVVSVNDFLMGPMPTDKLPYKLLEPWVTGSRAQTKIAIFLKTDSSSYIEELNSTIMKTSMEVFEGDIKVDIGGGALNGVALNQVMVRGKLFNILQIALAIFLVTSVVFRSLTAGILILAPLIFSVLANFGLMGMLGIPLQIATSIVSAIAVGIGADYGIYLSFRLREELNKNQSESVAFEKAFHSAGTATVYVASAVAGGFGVLMLSWGFYVHLWMGFLIASSMLFSALAALTLLPALILMLRPDFIFGKKDSTI